MELKKGIFRPSGPKATLRGRRVERLYLAMIIIAGAALMIGAIEKVQRGAWDGGIFWRLFLQYDVWPLYAIFAMLVLAVQWPLPDGWSEGLRRLGSHPLVLAIIVFVALCLGALFVYMNHSLSMDEYAPRFQAEIFASGKITGSWPPSLLGRMVSPNFDGTFLEASKSTGQVISCYWPGFALLLTPFTAVGMPWACNPFLTAVGIGLLYQITKRLAEESSPAAWAVLLAIASSTFTVSGISYYSMTAVLCLNLLFIYLLILGGEWRYFLAGVVGSMAVVASNPVPHIAFALPWLIWICFQPRRFRKIAMLALGYLPLSLLLGWGWLLLRAKVGIGMYVSSGFSWPTTEILEWRMVGFAKIAAWEVPGLMALALFGTIRFWRDSRVRALTGSALLTFCVYFVVPFSQGHGWGYRYFQAAWGALPILGALLLSRKSEGWRLRPPRLAGTVAIAILFSLLVLTPWRMAQVHSFVLGDLRQIPPHESDRPTVIFQNIDTGYYTADLVQNDPFLRSEVLHLISRGREKDSECMRMLLPSYVPRFYTTGSVWVDPTGSSEIPWLTWSGR
jgi:hypothetical protein